MQGRLQLRARTCASWFVSWKPLEGGSTVDLFRNRLAASFQPDGSSWREHVSTRASSAGLYMCANWRCRKNVWRDRRFRFYVIGLPAALITSLALTGFDGTPQRARLILHFVPFRLWPREKTPSDFMIGDRTSAGISRQLNWHAPPSKADTSAPLSSHVSALPERPSRRPHPPHPGDRTSALTAHSVLPLRPSPPQSA
ncbi:hypothetical protein C8F04DRAFT_1188400 [Mycena alexandri]|uniref:Uncharacterized protein n=1 Tax=Mycena alexandri TaxID=1745969 RepID=A0AAD6SJJ3_9AGAR|nr:hypothetical protein C8F04DRAFT_1188400 [Mycena alexandri]